MEGKDCFVPLPGKKKKYTWQGENCEKEELKFKKTKTK